MGWQGEGYTRWGRAVRGAAISQEVLARGGRPLGGCLREGEGVLGGGGGAGVEDGNLFG